MLKKFIQNLALDKKEHIVLGVIYSLLILIGGCFGSFGVFTGFIIGTFLNLYKEVYHDFYKGKGSPEFWDFVATQTPILIVLLTYLIK